MTSVIQVQVIAGLALPYVAGAEKALLDPVLDPAFNAAWQGLVAVFPGLTLVPLFDPDPPGELADIVDAIRLNGDEPPDPFVWFTLTCDEADVAALVPALEALPIIVRVNERRDVALPATVSYGTNPLTTDTFQIQPTPVGVDAIYVWQIAGGAGDNARLVDIEGGWLLGHDELLAANIHLLSVVGSESVDHGTAVAGILVGGDNGVGTIGIVPNARLDLVTVDRGSRASEDRQLADAIRFATARLAKGDVMLIEAAYPFRYGNELKILVEFDFAVQNAITRATLRGITVIEPAGNGSVPLDDFPFLAHTRPDSPTFSGAIVVGAGELNAARTTWTRTFSSFGKRVDCFAAGSNIRAPSSTTTSSYQIPPQFSGTSGASAIIAGVAASLQSMVKAAAGAQAVDPFLLPSDVRRILRSASLGTLPADPVGAKIGSMPDLRAIVQAQGLVRILPIGAAFIGGDALLIVHLDAGNRLVRRHFTLLTGWGQPIPLPSPQDQFQATGSQLAVTSTDEDDPLSRVVFDAYFLGPGGIHQMVWDTRDFVADPTKPVAPLTVAAQGRALAAVRVFVNLVVIAATSPEGRLVTLTGDPSVLHSGMSDPLLLDTVGGYRRGDGPVMVSRGTGLADVVAIEDGGALTWFTGVFFVPVGNGFFSTPIVEPSAVAFDPGARPALLVNGDTLLAAAVGADGSLRVATLDPVAKTIDISVEVDASVRIDRSGPVALGLTAANVVVLGVDTRGTLRAATRPIAGGSWTSLSPVLSPIAISPAGGVTAVTIDVGVVAIIVGVDGIVCSTISADGLIWVPIIVLP